MKITKVELKNFQGHKDSVFYPKDGLNTLVGATNQGKSSVHRALTWLIDNKIAGDRPNQNIHNHDIVTKTKSDNIKFLDNTIVTVTLDTGHIVQRIKGKDNLYKMTYPDGTTKDLTANGQNVPLEVQELFKFDYLNIADQKDSYFIMFDTAGEIAKKINEIVDLSLGDKLLKGLKSKTRAKNSKIKNIEEDITQLKEDLKEYENLDSMEKDLDKLTDLCNNKDKLQEEIQNINKYKESLSTIEFELEQIGDVASELESIQALYSLYETVVQLRDKKRSIESYLSDIVYLNNELSSCKNVEQELKDIEKLQELFNKALNLEGTYRVYKSKTEEIRQLNEEIKSLGDGSELETLVDLIEKAHTRDLLVEKSNGIKEAIGRLTELNLEVKKVSQECDEATEAFEKAMADQKVCPLCGK